MTTTQETVATAPRDLEELKKLGRFNLRVIAQEAGGFANEASKSSFMSLNNDKQAETVLALLLDIDKKKGGGAATGTGKRQPVNSSKKAPANGAAAAGAAAAGAGAAAASTAGNEGGGKGLGGEGAAKLLAAVQALTEKYDGIKEELSNLNAGLETLQSICSGTNRFATVSIGLNLKLAEQVLQASPEQILQIVIDDMPMVERALLSMAPPAEEGGEDEEDDEEGNE